MHLMASTWVFCGQSISMGGTLLLWLEVWYGWTLMEEVRTATGPLSHIWSGIRVALGYIPAAWMECG